MPSYIITDAAGDYVAGVRVHTLEPGPDGQRRLVLTEDQASYLLTIGALVADTAPVSALAEPAEPSGRRAGRATAPEV